MSHVIGIDLGTFNCCVAVVEGYTPTVIPNKVGYTTTSSTVAVTEEGRRIVGQIALRQAVINPKNTIYAAKRLMGRKWDSAPVRHAVKHAAFTLLEGANGDTRVQLGEHEFSIPEISAMLLQEMRVVAEQYLGSDVNQAVITVPAYFNDSQRQAVRDAGRIAGLDVLRMINEPTAAALAYGYGKGEDSLIAVYDLGGGTFDVSIVRILASGTFEVVATVGDSYLGGEDFDNRIVERLLQLFAEQHAIDLREAPMAMQRLKEAAEKAKRELSSVKSTKIDLPFIASNDGGPIHLSYDLTREELERMTGDLITKTLQICEKTMGQAKVGSRGLSDVLLVGGMTRMPAVQYAVKEYFDREPCKGVHPDEVVAIGAAIQGAALMEKIEDVQLHDVTAHSLGIMTAGGGFDVLIRSNTQVPIEVPGDFTTSRDNQTTIKIIVLQGESKAARENELLGSLSLSNLRAAPAGDVDIEVTFRINADGIFSVAGRNVETGEVQRVEVAGNSGLDDTEIQKMIDESASFLAERRAEERGEAVLQAFETLVVELERGLNRLEGSGSPGAATILIQGRGALDRGRTLLNERDTLAMSNEMPRFELLRTALGKQLG